MLLNCGNTLSLLPCSGLGLIESCYWNFWLYSLDTWGSGGAEVFFERTFKQTDESLSLKPTHPLQPCLTPSFLQRPVHVCTWRTLSSRNSSWGSDRSHPTLAGSMRCPLYLSLPAPLRLWPSLYWSNTDQWSSFPLRSLELSTTSCSRTRSFSATSNVQLDISRWVCWRNHDSAGTVG